MKKSCDTCVYGDPCDFGEKCAECISTKGHPPCNWEPAEWWKPDTNGDRIRAMSDEELADTMSMHTATGACNDWGIPHQKCGGNCRECIIDWLKQPAEL